MSPCLFDLYADYIMRGARVDVSQAGIKIAWKKDQKDTKKETSVECLEIIIVRIQMEKL